MTTLGTRRVCVRVCVRALVCVRACVRACVCVCARVRARAHVCASVSLSPFFQSVCAREKVECFQIFPSELAVFLF